MSMKELEGGITRSNVVAPLSLRHCETECQHIEDTVFYCCMIEIVI